MSTLLAIVIQAICKTGRNTEKGIEDLWNVFYRFLPGIFLLLFHHRASIYSLSVFHLLIFPFPLLLFLSLPPADRLGCLSTIINNFRRVFFPFAFFSLGYIEFHTHCASLSLEYARLLKKKIARKLIIIHEYKIVIEEDDVLIVRKVDKIGSILGIHSQLTIKSFSFEILILRLQFIVKLCLIGTSLFSNFFLLIINEQRNEQRNINRLNLLLKYETNIYLIKIDMLYLTIIINFIE